MITQTTSKKQSRTPATQATPCAGATYGQLTVTEVRPDSLLTAKCACGFPALVIPTDAWGLVLGCAACHGELAREAAEEAEREQREQERAERAEQRESQLRDTYYTPHYDDLSRADKRLFRHLANTYQFDRNSVASYLRVTTEEAWEIIQRLLWCNLLVEREKLPFTGVRQYRLGQNYAMLASPESTYSCRASAVAQMALEPSPTPAAESAEEVEGSAYHTVLCGGGE